MKISILQNNSSLIIHNSEVDINAQIYLYELYLPIIGNDAINLYLYLKHLKNVSNKYGINKVCNIQQIMNSLNTNVNDLHSTFNKLESMQLLTIYESQESSKPVIIQINDALSFIEFENNVKFKELLYSKLDQATLLKLQYMFNMNFIPKGYTNITDNLYNLENNENINYQEELINWEKLLKQICLQYSKKIEITNHCKEIVTNYYKTLLLSDDAVIKTLIKSCEISTNSSLTWIVSKDKLLKNLNKLESETNNITSKINRDFNIFKNHINLVNYQNVISDYKTINPENYILYLEKQPLTAELKHMIKVVTNKLNLDSSLLNVLIDYSTFKNLGRIVPNYVIKLAHSISNLMITKVEDVIKHLQKYNNNINFMSFDDDTFDKFPKLNHLELDN